jgi:hypothetical protein
VIENWFLSFKQLTGVNGNNRHLKGSCKQHTGQSSNLMQFITVYNCHISGFKVSTGTLFSCYTKTNQLGVPLAGNKTPNKKRRTQTM